MKVKNVTMYLDIVGKFKPDNVVWMCEVNPSNLPGPASLRPPRRGRLMPHNTKAVNEYFLTQTNPEDWVISHFIPFKKNSDTELSYGLAEPIFKSGYLSFASTETECIELYEELILEAMNPYRETLARLQREIDAVHKIKYSNFFDLPYGAKHPEYGGTIMNLLELPDNTWFHVDNECWNGFITSDEKGHRVVYTGVSEDNPTGEYVKRFVFNKGDRYDAVVSKTRIIEIS